MKYPEYAIKELENQNKQLQMSFERIWGVLSPSPERDTIMYHIIKAKTLINNVLEENKNG